jgi:hypothetical protein
MADLWLPGFDRWELPGVPGVPYDEPDDPKALLHTTEGSTIEGAVQAYKAFPPQLIVDPVRKRKVQHIPLNRGGYALWNADADDSRCYQVEIVGFAAQSHLWSDEVLRWLGEELARPLHEYGGVPYVVVRHGFHRAGGGLVLASARSPIRLTQAELDSFSGFLGHQHVPGDDHWDPGGLNVSRILEYAKGDDVSWNDELTNESGFRAPAKAYLTGTNDRVYLLTNGEIPVAGEDRTTNLVTEISWLPANFRAVNAQLAALVELVAAKQGISPDAFAAAVDAAVRRHTPTAEQIAQAQEATIAPLVETALRRVQDTDNLDEARQTATELLRLIGAAAPTSTN